jgi:hypothetical protein
MTRVGCGAPPAHTREAALRGVHEHEGVAAAVEEHHVVGRVGG